MSNSPKIGAGHASAMFRLGLRETRNAFSLSRDSIADTELGLYGTRTPGEVAELRQTETKPRSHEQDRNSEAPERER